MIYNSRKKYDTVLNFPTMCRYKLLSKKLLSFKKNSVNIEHQEQDLRRQITIQTLLGLRRGQGCPLPHLLYFFNKFFLQMVRA